MPGPEGLAHRGWLGVVMGIRLIHIIAAGTAERHGDVLVYIHWCILTNISIHETMRRSP